MKFSSPVIRKKASDSLSWATFHPHLEVLYGNLSFQRRKGRSYEKLFGAILQS
jgi:hypothetical protein